MYFSNKVCVSIVFLIENTLINWTLVLHLLKLAIVTIEKDGY